MCKADAAAVGEHDGTQRRACDFGVLGVQNVHQVATAPCVASFAGRFARDAQFAQRSNRTDRVPCPRNEQTVARRDRCVRRIEPLGARVVRKSEEVHEAAQTEADAHQAARQGRAQRVGQPQARAVRERGPIVESSLAGDRRYRPRHHRVRVVEKTRRRRLLLLVARHRHCARARARVCVCVCVCRGVSRSGKFFRGGTKCAFLFLPPLARVCPRKVSVRDREPVARGAASLAEPVVSPSPVGLLR